MRWHSVVFVVEAWCLGSVILCDWTLATTIGCIIVLARRNREQTDSKGDEDDHEEDGDGETVCVMAAVKMIVRIIDGDGARIRMLTVIRKVMSRWCLC